MKKEHDDYDEFTYEDEVIVQEYKEDDGLNTDLILDEMQTVIDHYAGTDPKIECIRPLDVVYPVYYPDNLTHKPIKESEIVYIMAHEIYDTIAYYYESIDDENKNSFECLTPIIIYYRAMQTIDKYYVQ